MDESKAEELLHAFDEKLGTYLDFTQAAHHLIETLLGEHNLRFLSVTSRVKQRESLHAKLRRPDATYVGIDGVTDICGIRIISYFAADVDAIAEVFAAEFDIDSKNSVDRRKTLDPDRFGYLSLHYVAKLSPVRLGLTEYQRYCDCVLEVQIRSQLQHAWAEIEHDLGYKAEVVPRPIRRRLSRVAGILEVADAEFDSIRTSLDMYESEVPDLILSSPGEVGIDHVSISALISLNALVQAVDDKIVSSLAITLHESEDYGRNVAEAILQLGVTTIEETVRLLESQKEVVARFGIATLSDHEELPHGVSLWLLGYVESARKGKEQLARYITEMPFAFKDVKDRDQHINEVMGHYKTATSS